MKILKKIFLFSLLITINHSIAQSINDTIFKNVILIEKGNVLQDNDDYLIDVVMDFNINNIPIVYNDSRLPKNFFLNKLFKSKSFILITPDWKFYNAVAEEADQMGGCIEPATTNIYYQREYIKNKSRIDSIRVSGNQPKSVFSSSIKVLKASENIVFYYTVEFGSICCPRDLKWEMKGKLNDFISTFEMSNNVKLGDIYKKITGKEGEHILYFTLSNLNQKQKLNFLQEIRFLYFKNVERKHIELSPQIYTPSSIKKEGLKLIS